MLLRVDAHKFQVLRVGNFLGRIVYASSCDLRHVYKCLLFGRANGRASFSSRDYCRVQR